MSEDATLDEFVEENNPDKEETAEPDLMTSLDETSVGDIPSDWSSVRLEQLTQDTLYGANESAEDFDPEKPRYIRIKDIDDRGRLKEEEKASLSQEKAEGYLLQKGDMLFARSGSPGRTYLHRHNNGKFCYGGYSIKHELVSDGLNNEYLSQYTKSQKYWDWIERIARTGAQANINSQEYASLLVPFPPLSEQRKIATVLHNVDQAIQKTEEIIDHHQKLKKGIRQDIFQHGGLSSEKTTTQRIGPKEYEMPKDWEVTNLSQVAEIKGGQGFKSSNYVDKGVPLIKISNVQNGYLDLQDTSYLPEEYLDEYSEVALSEGDVVLVLTRPIIGDGIKSARIEQNDRFLLNQRLAVIDPINKNTVTREYLYHLIFTNVFIDQVKATVRATHQPNLSKTDLQNFSLPVPEIEQQKKICRVLGSIEEVVEENKSYQSNLKRMKHGLMQDLLSGTVRTTDTNIEVPDEIAQHG